MGTCPSGKTFFMKRIIDWCMKRNKPICIINNRLKVYSKYSNYTNLLYKIINNASEEEKKI